MATNKAQPDRLTVSVYEAGSAQLFSQTSAMYYGEAGTLAWALAGRAYLAGYEQPEVYLTRSDGRRIEVTRPSRAVCESTYYRGARFWAQGNTRYQPEEATT